MSTIGYAQLTTKRENAQPNRSTRDQSPGMATFVDALAALVPAEVLTVHGVIISLTTTTVDGNSKIDALETLYWSFWGLFLLAMVVYAAARLIANKWDDWDWLRVFIPALAFMGWTMLQRTTAFDAVFPSLPSAPRSVLAIFLAVLIGIAATALAYKADQKIP